MTRENSVLHLEGKFAVTVSAKIMVSGRAKFFLVVSDLKPVLRDGDRARCWLQS
jgi:hypothetical protein